MKKVSTYDVDYTWIKNKAEEMELSEADIIEALIFAVDEEGIDLNDHTW